MWRLYTLLLFCTIIHIGFSQDVNVQTKKIDAETDSLQKVQLIIQYVDSLLWREDFSANTKSYIDEAIAICKTHDCGEQALSYETHKDLS